MTDLLARVLAMAWSYVLHATEQMRKRGISKEEVEAVLANPQIVHEGNSPPGRPPRKVYRSTVGGRRLKVVVQEADQKVITVAAVDE